MVSHTLRAGQGPEGQRRGEVDVVVHENLRTTGTGDSPPTTRMFFHCALLTTVEEVADMREDMVSDGEDGGRGREDGRMRKSNLDQLASA